MNDLVQKNWVQRIETQRLPALTAPNSEPIQLYSEYEWLREKLHPFAELLEKHLAVSVSNSELNPQLINLVYIVRKILNPEESPVSNIQVEQMLKKLLQGSKALQDYVRQSSDSELRENFHDLSAQLEARYGELKKQNNATWSAQAGLPSPISSKEKISFSSL